MTIKEFFKLIRIKNIIIIILTQYAIRYLIVRTILDINGLELRFSELDFFLLVLSTIFITASGYVINDYFDTKTDIINKPDEVVVGKVITRRKAIIIHSVFNIIGIGFGVYLSFKIDIPVLSLIFILITGILWFYSTTYKRQFLIGNVIVALLTALVPLMVLLFEIPVLISTYGEIMNYFREMITTLTVWVSAFAFYAFMTTMIREIIKDVEDYEGDKAFGRNSLPIVLGVKTTKIVIVSLVFIVIISLFYFWYEWLDDILSLIYFISFLGIPLIFLVFYTMKARNKEQYSQASRLIKSIMLAGILYAGLACYIIYDKI